MCSFRLCGSIVANAIIYRLVPSPSRYEIRQYNCFFKKPLKYRKLNKNENTNAPKLTNSYGHAYYICTVWCNYSWNMYGLLTKCEVKMPICVILDRDEVEAHKLAKKERGQYPAILSEQTWSTKDLFFLAGNFSCGLFFLAGNFSCGTRRVVPLCGQDNSLLYG